MAKRVRARVAVDEREGDEADRWLAKHDAKHKSRHRDSDDDLYEDTHEQEPKHRHIHDTGGAFKQREPMDLSGLEEGLRIEKDALDDGLLQQPDLFYRVSKELTLATSRRDAAKQGVADAEANVELALHRSKDKYTVGEIKAHIAVAPSVKAARKMLADLQYEVNALNGLKEAFSQRSYALKELVALFIANYYGDIDTRAARKVTDVKYMDARKRMNEERKRQEAQGDD